MKRFKNLFLMLLALVLSVTLVSCGGGKDDDPKPQIKKTVVKFCSWNFGTEEENNLTRRKIEQFNKTSSTIRIEMVTPVDGTGYDDFLTTMAAANELPDVFMVNSVPTAVINKWALDVTELGAKDPEWNNIPTSLKDAVTYNGHTYGIPAGQYYMGLFANYDLIDEYLTGSQSAEERFATGEFTTEEWIEVVKQMRDINHNDGTGKIGINATGDMINWLPSVLDETGNTKHFVWNGKSFDLRSQIMFDALEKIADLGDTTSQYSFASVPEMIGEGEEAQENRAKIFGTTDPISAFTQGSIGFFQEGSWAVQFEEVDFNYSFISYPDAKVISAADYMCISKATKNQDAAYEVAKYMTFGEQGMKDTFKIIDDNKDAKLSVSGIPLNTTKELSDKWFSYIKMNGLQETFNKVASGDIEVIVEGNKSTPGFLQARYHFQTGISIETVRGGALLSIGDFIWEVCSGTIPVNEYITRMTEELEKEINSAVTNAFAQMGLTQ